MKKNTFWNVIAFGLLALAFIFSVVAVVKEPTLKNDIVKIFEVSPSTEIADKKETLEKITEEKRKLIDSLLDNKELSSSEREARAAAYQALDSEEFSLEHEQEIISSKIVNLRNYYLLPVSVILGFLAILYLIIIEKQRLDNERDHNREKAKDNLKDLAAYGKKLFKDIDKRHYDFLFYDDELRKAGLRINVINLQNFPALASLYSFEQCKWWFDWLVVFITKENYPHGMRKQKCPHHKAPQNSMEWIKRFFFKTEYCNYVYSIELIAVLYEMMQNDPDSEALKSIIPDIESTKHTIEALYFAAMSKNYDEFLTSVNTDRDSGHTIMEDIHEIGTDMGEFILKKDFDVAQNSCIVDSYLKILNLLKQFRNVMAGKKLDNSSQIDAAKVKHIFPV